MPDADAHSGSDSEPRAAVERELVAEALEAFERGGRAAFEQVCAAHPEQAGDLRRRLEALAGLGLMRGSSSSGAPQRLGRFAIRRVLGSGGMGVVYLAHDDKLGRDVALKTLPPHLYGSARTHERFAREVRAVAQLRHPGIVSVYELDEADGVPFFSMEYVPGETLAAVLERVRALGLAPDQLAAEHLQPAGAGSTTRRPRSYIESVCRIAIDVARALAHAHERGVVHRDVKPANVLLAQDGSAHLFDFGLAQVESDDRLTLSGDVVGTYAYMSPEQAAGRGDELDSRTDVFSLGATLYELLALRPPFAGANAQQVLRQITSKEPPPLRKLNASVPADLETICATALEKDRARRYASASDLADDLQRLLELRPITARPASTWTRTQRFVRRNPALALSAALGLILLVGAPIGTGIANHYLARERDLARAAGASSERMLEFLVSLLELADAEELGPDVPARELLVQGSRWLLDEGHLADQPAARARLMTTLGSIFALMSEFERADPLLTKALELETAELGRDDPQTAFTLNHLGNLRRAQGRLAESEPMFREALSVYERAYGPEHRDALIVLGNLGTLLAELGQPALAEDMCRRVIELGERSPDTPPLERLRARIALANVLLSELAWDEAEPILRDALSQSVGVPRTDLVRGQCEMGLGRVAIERGELALARQHFAAAVELYTAMLGRQALHTAVALRWLGDAQARAGAASEAVATLRESVAGLLASGGPDHLDLGLAHWALGFAYLGVRDYGSAADALAEAVRILTLPNSSASPQQIALLNSLYGDCLLVSQRDAEAVEPLVRSTTTFRALGEHLHVHRATALVYLALARTRSGHAAEAEPALDEAREVLAGIRDAPARLRVGFHGAVGECLAAQLRFEAAEVELIRSFELLPSPAEIHPLARRRTYQRLIDLYAAWGKPEESERWRAKLAEADP